jgi:hypothetical protein
MTTLMHDHRATHTGPRTIPGLAGTTTHELGIEVYQAHHDVGNGFCPRCGNRHPCSSRRGAAELIAAAGDDPRRYDGPPTQFAYSPSGVPPGGHWHAANPAAAVSSLQPIGRPPQIPHDGFPVGGASRAPLDSEGYLYERDRR